MNWLSRSFAAAIAALLLAVFSLMPLPAAAQSTEGASAPPAENLLKPEELEGLVAPIALYPDTLLAVVLMAATYPLEVVQADRWLGENKKLKEDEVKQAVEKQAWDESVKALAATPDVLSMMSKELDWTQKLGDAVLSQQPDVMDAIQRLRARAHANKKLEPSKEQNVIVKQVDNRQVIAIEPTNPNTVHVPYYDPAVVYGAWPYPAYPASYFPPPGYLATGVIATGIAFGSAYAIGRWASGGNYWGGNVNWNQNNIIANRPININNAGNNWQHRPEHRQGVRYNNPSVQQKFGGTRPGSEQRLDNRGGDRQPGSQAKGSQAKGSQAKGSQAKGSQAKGSQAKGGQAKGKGSQAKGGQGKGSQAKGKGSQAKGAKGGQTKGAKGKQTKGGQAKSGGQASRGAGAAQRGGARSGGAARAGGGGRSGGGGRAGGGGRRSDIRAKCNIELLGQFDNGLGFYRFTYRGSHRAFVGVMAQEVQTVMPEAVTRGRDGYLRVLYEKLSLRFQTYEQWIAAGAQIPQRLPSVGDEGRSPRLPPNALTLAVATPSSDRGCHE